MLQAVVCKGQTGARLKGCRRQMRAAVAAWSTLACQHPAASVHLEPLLPMLVPQTCPKTGAKTYLFCTVHCNCSANLPDDKIITAHGCHGVVAKMKLDLMLDAGLHFASAINTTHLVKLSPSQLHCKRTFCCTRLLRQHRSLDRLSLAVVHVHMGTGLQRCGII